MEAKLNLGQELHKYRNFIEFPDVEILWKGTVSAEFQANRHKLYGNCVFSQNIHTKKLDEISVFNVVKVSNIC